MPTVSITARSFIFLGLALGALCVFATSGLVFAQEDVRDDGQAVQIQHITQTNENTQVKKTISELKERQLNEIESYRQAEHAFSVAKTEFRQLETLRSLEEAVQATRTVMQRRLQVLMTYNELLLLVLEETSGVELSAKQAALKELEVQVVELRLHAQAIDRAESRDDMAQLRDDFALLRPQFIDRAYRALSLIEIGRLRTVHDAAGLILIDIEKRFDSDEDNAALRQSQRNRALVQAKRTHAELGQELVKINGMYQEEQGELVGRSFYTRINTQLRSLFSKTNQSLSQLEELLRL